MIRVSERLESPRGLAVRWQTWIRVPAVDQRSVLLSTAAAAIGHARRCLLGAQVAERKRGPIFEQVAGELYESAVRWLLLAEQCRAEARAERAKGAKA
jgi:hypothetical protein